MLEQMGVRMISPDHLSFQHVNGQPTCKEPMNNYFTNISPVYFLWKRQDQFDVILTTMILVDYLFHARNPWVLKLE